ncbi:hypothetical protein O181_097986 [Austropuccinia psidii MF-1]|uniref:Transposase Helix-turn-helix domain-containing protein n=1 Tax=Austropuccinia psidii MF-1 TaxID=1389203 RepID=A0A9Q3JAH7_9BASI|nr:hypothetical protein [Austropuccinia psidii MF-1]
MGREDFFSLINALMNQIPNAYQHNTRGLTIEEKLGIMLYRLGHGSSYETVGHIFNVGKSTAYQVTKVDVQAIQVSLHDSTIVFPGIDDAQKWQEMEEKFRQRQGLTNILGAINGTHIPIITPPK